VFRDDSSVFGGDYSLFNEKSVAGAIDKVLAGSIVFV